MLQVMRMYIYMYIRLYKYICVYIILSLSIMCHPFRNCVWVCVCVYVSRVTTYTHEVNQTNHGDLAKLLQRWSEQVSKIGLGNLHFDEQQDTTSDHRRFSKKISLVCSEAGFRWDRRLSHEKLFVCFLFILRKWKIIIWQSGQFYMDTLIL